MEDTQGRNDPYHSMIATLSRKAAGAHLASNMDKSIGAIVSAVIHLYDALLPVHSSRLKQLQ